MRETEVIERLEGAGRLRDKAGQTWDVDYAITICQEYHCSRTGAGESRVPGMRTIEGTIDGLDEVSLIGLCGETFTLKLEDGRHWDCILMNTNGDLVNTGRGLYRPS